MSSMTRRRFLQGSLATGSIAFTRMKASSQVLGANNRIRVAIAGINGRGGSHIQAFRDMAGAEIACLVDPDSRLFASRVKAATQKGGREPQTVQDIRRVLEDKNVDVVSIATPNHWHSLMTIWACQAGKDVYVEKPCSHNIHEGRIAVETARKYKRIVQHGTQSRTRGGWENAVAAIHSGKYGKLLVARGLCYKSGTPGEENTRGDIGFRPPKDPPRELDFNIWLGPAPRQAYHENLVHYRWHWFWDFGNGDIGNQGVHEMDLARWGVKGGTLPRSVISVGGRFGPKDQGETANSQIAIFDYGDTQLIFEERGLPSEKYQGEAVGVLYHLEEGTIRGSGKFFPKGSDKAEPLPDMHAERGPGRESHFDNFIAAVRSRKVSDLNADILEGHYSAALCHLANASYRVGEEVPFNGKTKAFGDNKEAYESFGRMEEYLQTNKFSLSDMKYRLGRKLTIDPKTELTDDENANKILTGTYRPPFVVPETVV